MVKIKLGIPRAIRTGIAAGAFAVLLSAFIGNSPAHALSSISVNWTNALTVQLGGNALSSPVTISGDFVGNVVGTPEGSQSYLGISNGPVQTTFGCTVSLSVQILPDGAGNLHYDQGNIIFDTTAPSTCSKDTLNTNFVGLATDPFSGPGTLIMTNVPFSDTDKRSPAGGNTNDKGVVNVTAGMGLSSGNSDLPGTDVLTLCEAKGAYLNNIDALIADCLARKASALAAPALTTDAIQLLQNGKGPGNDVEKAWTGMFANVTPGNYVACSQNFKACQLFTKNPGSAANVYVTFGNTPGSVIPGTPPGQGQGTTEEKVCTTGTGLSGGLAWILCPAAELIASATRFFEQNIIVPFMTVSPLTTNANNPVYILWQNIRNFANVGFIIIFLIVIFSQTTSLGISNYGIKRLLPRMVAAIIAVNLSYFLVAFVIDAFNIFGAGISQLVTTALQQTCDTDPNAAKTAMCSPQLNGGSNASASAMYTLGGAALLTVILSAGAAIGWFFSFLGLALLVIVVVVFVLVIRQLGIIMLVIVAPVAILLMILPNTEQYFKKWRHLLIQLLMMYPIIVLLFAAGKIFGVVLQQPDFKIAGDGVSGDVADAIRVILQFLVYVIPLVFLPATFAASGSLMSRAFGALNGRLVQPRANRLKEDAASMGGEARMRLAKNKVPYVGAPIRFAAGRGLRRRYIRDSRQRNLQREQEDYVAESLGQSPMMRAAAAGVAGQAGQTRAASYAAKQADKGRSEDLDNEMALLNGEMRKLGIDQKTFAGAIGKYLEKPDVEANQSITSADGKHTFNFATQGATLQRALLNSAASQGEIKAIESARLSDNVDQTMLDDIIRRNDPKLKEKGGYHLATNFSLRADHVAKTNEKGEIVDTTNKKYEGKPGQTIAYYEPDDMDGKKREMVKQRVIAMASSGANSVAGMKAGLLEETSKIITNDTTALTDPSDIAERQAMHDAIMNIDPKLRERLRDTATSIYKNPNVMSKTEAKESVIKAISEIAPRSP